MTEHRAAVSNGEFAAPSLADANAVSFGHDVGQGPNGVGSGEESRCFNARPVTNALLDCLRGQKRTFDVVAAVTGLVGGSGAGSDGGSRMAARPKLAALRLDPYREIRRSLQDGQVAVYVSWGRSSRGGFHVCQ